MTKIKKFLVGIFLITQLTIGSSNISIASSSEHISSCAKDDTLLITLVSAGIVVLEKIGEKLYKYLKTKYGNNNNTELEQTNITNNEV